LEDSFDEKHHTCVLSQTMRHYYCKNLNIYVFFTIIVLTSDLKLFEFEIIHHNLRHQLFSE